MAIVRVQLRGDTANNWSVANPVLGDREMALETDTDRFKIGDGVTNWNSLGYGGLVATNPVFYGTVTAPTFSGNLTGNATTATSATTATTATTSKSSSAGTSYPASPSAGWQFYRTDLKQLYVYDGSAWVVVGGGSVVEPFIVIGV